MSSKAGLPSTIIRYTIPATAGGVAYTNGGVKITSLDAGRYLGCVAYSVDPATVGQTITGVSYAVTQTAVLGGVGAVGLIQHVQSAATGVNVNNQSTNCAIFQIVADDTPIFFSLTATTGAGNYVSSALALDAQSSVISFVKLE